MSLTDDKIFIVNRFNKDIKIQSYDWQVIATGNKTYTISVLAKTVVDKDQDMPVYLKDINKAKDTLTILI